MSLSDVLLNADVEDLDVLTDYITDKGEGRLSLDSDVCKRLISCKQSGHYSRADRELIDKEIRAFGGNSIVNLFRGGEGIKYGELVSDVGTHLKVNFAKKAPAANIEVAILQKIFTDSVARMSEVERKQVLAELNVGELAGAGPAQLATAIGASRLAGFATYRMAVIVANGISKALLGKGLTLAANAGLTRVIALATGPIGWVITGLWTIADLASPAYRVTVPCVIQVAYMRLKASNAKLAAPTTLALPPPVVEGTSATKSAKDDHAWFEAQEAKKKLVASSAKRAAKKVVAKKATSKKTAAKKKAPKKATAKQAASKTPMKKTAAAKKVSKKSGIRANKGPALKKAAKKTIKKAGRH
ncbi:ubiquinol-cytochrome C chaperone family protein [Dyella sp.]|jgi:uncharacterized protein YaaW (UPF0174 family)|uniref:YaaW family protein n=1 Tax=Dyella sp. TaxID=1869338 RepID=UPI002FDA1A43